MLASPRLPHNIGLLVFALFTLALFDFALAARLKAGQQRSVPSFYHTSSDSSHPLSSSSDDPAWSPSRDKGKGKVTDTEEETSMTSDESGHRQEFTPPREFSNPSSTPPREFSDPSRMSTTSGAATIDDNEWRQSLKGMMAKGQTRLQDRYKELIDFNNSYKGPPRLIKGYHSPEYFAKVRKMRRWTTLTMIRAKEMGDPKTWNELREHRDRLPKSRMARNDDKPEVNPFPVGTPDWNAEELRAYNRHSKGAAATRKRVRAYGINTAPSKVRIRGANPSLRRQVVNTAQRESYAKRMQAKRSAKEQVSLATSEKTSSSRAAERRSGKQTVGQPPVSERFPRWNQARPRSKRGRSGPP